MRLTHYNCRTPHSPCDPAAKARLEEAGHSKVLKLSPSAPPRQYLVPATPAGVATFAGAVHHLRDYTSGGDDGSVAGRWWLLDADKKERHLHLVTEDALRVDAGHVGYKGSLSEHRIASKHMRLYLAERFLEDPEAHQASCEAWEAQYREGLAGLLTLALLSQGFKQG
jgi:hypothetical protein